MKAVLMQTTMSRTNDSLRAVVATRLRRLGWVSVVAAMALSGCTAKKTEAPELAGPSEMGLSLDIRATPDVVTMDGQSQSQLIVTARDANGRPAGSQGVRVEITAGGEIVDYGRLSTKNVTTGSDGRATVTYTAPAGAPSQNSDGHTVITLIATPAGYDYRNALARQVDIRLVPQGVILPIAYAPVPKFTFSPTAPGEDADVTFDASSSIASCVPNPTAPNDTSQCQPQAGTIVAYQWDFGNGNTASGVRPTTRFATRGSYVVKLTVTNDRGLSNSVTNTVAVAGVANPTADFAFSPTAPAVNQNVFFDAAASQAAPGRTISRYDWTFGDGSEAGGANTSHRYTRIGSYAVTLTVTDSAGRTGTSTKSVPVGAGLAPVANFTFSPSTPAVNQRVFFDGTSSTPPAGRTIVRWVWNFGENGLAEGERVEYVYRTGGTYSVVLTVTDSGGGTHTTTKTVPVQ
jgi:PKD repeat protein